MTLRSRTIARRMIWSGVAAVVVSVVVAFSAAAAGTSSSHPVGDHPTSEAPRSTVPPATPLPVAADHGRPVIALYGDSLAWEAEHHFQRRLEAAGAEVVARTWGGTAICDFFDEMVADAAALHPDAVVVEFSGNGMSACISERARTQGLLSAYRTDAHAVVALFPGTRVYFAGAPAAPQPAGASDFNGGEFDALYQAVAQRHPNARFVDAGASVLDEGRWTRTLPCRPDEPCTGGVDDRGEGVNVVRAPDGAHFCPDGAEARDGVTGGCAVWSSGAFRYGTAMADAVGADLPSP